MKSSLEVISQNVWSVYYTVFNLVNWYHFYCLIDVDKTCLDSLYVTQDPDTLKKKKNEPKDIEENQTKQSYVDPR